VGENHRRAIVVQDASQDAAGKDVNIVDSAVKQRFEGLETVPTVDKQHGKHFTLLAGQAQS
jgi:hypothetical protein